MNDFIERKTIIDVFNAFFDIFFIEWDLEWPGPEVIVEVRETATDIQRNYSMENSTSIEEGKSPSSK